MKTLCVFTGGIGDTLLAGPAFAHLRDQGSLDLAGNPDRLALIQAADACDGIHDLDHIEFHTLFEDPSPKLRTFIQKYDRIIVWMRDDGAIQQALKGCGTHDVKVVPGIPPESWRSHATDYYLSGIDAALAKPRPPLRITKWEGEALAEPNYDIIIHPGSGSPTKNWPIENFVSVANAFENAGRQVAWIRGPAEEQLNYPANAEFVEAVDLISLSRCLAHANCFVGNDSGTTHLAAATGCQIVAVFGPTDPAVWAPRGDHVQVVAKHPWPTVEIALETLNIETG